MSLLVKSGDLTVNALFDLRETIASTLFDGICFPWEVLDKIEVYIKTLGPKLSEELFDHPEEGIWIAKSAKVASTACLNGPLIVDEGAEIRHCAYIRGNVIIGKNAVVGNSTELKNAVLFNGVQVPHYNYVGDSILGHLAHMGAGAITSNVKADKTFIVIPTEEGCLDTGRKKVGAMLGDRVEVGCNAVLNPGTVVGRNSNIYPLSCVRGVVTADSIYKAAGNLVNKK